MTALENFLTQAEKLVLSPVAQSLSDLASVRTVAELVAEYREEADPDALDCLIPAVENLLEDFAMYGLGEIEIYAAVDIAKEELEAAMQVAMLHTSSAG